MKILFIFNDKKLTDTYSNIEKLMTYVDKKYPGTVIKFDIMEDNTNDMTELIEAYHENDFDIYIIDAKSDFIYDEKKYTKFFSDNNLSTDDVMIVYGTDTLLNNLKEIKNFITASL